MRVVGIYRGHKNAEALCAIENDDDDTIITGSRDRFLRVWNKITCECLRVVGPLESGVVSILKSDKSVLLCGLYNGQMKFLRLCDFQLVGGVSMN